MFMGKNNFQKAFIGHSRVRRTEEKPERVSNLWMSSGQNSTSATSQIDQLTFGIVILGVSQRFRMIEYFILINNFVKLFSDSWV